VSVNAALESGTLRSRLRRVGHQIETVDATLAATALLDGDVLLTDDRDFAPLAGDIRIENWLR
jgi:predicted nucleic acid-binding protein